MTKKAPKMFGINLLVEFNSWFSVGDLSLGKMMSVYTSLKQTQIHVNTSLQRLQMIGHLSHCTLYTYSGYNTTNQVNFEHAQNIQHNLTFL